MFGFEIDDLSADHAVDRASPTGNFLNDLHTRLSRAFQARENFVGLGLQGVSGKDGDGFPENLVTRRTAAALITASLVSGGLYAGATDSQASKLRAFGLGIGLAFQIVDDILDVTQTSEQLGKTAGKDTASEKATYPALFGIEASTRKADALVSAAFAELESFGEKAEPLKQLARFLVERKN